MAVLVDENKAKIRKALLECFADPVIIALFVLVLTIPFWVMPAAYGLLLTYRIDEHGTIVWSLLISMAVSYVWLWAKWILLLRNFSRKVQRYKKAGNEEGRQAYVAVHKPSPRLVMASTIVLHLSIPVFIALIIWSTIAPVQPVRSVKNPSKVVTRQDVLNGTLAGMRKRGFVFFGN